MTLSDFISLSFLDKNKHVEEDDLPARAIQESWNFETIPRENGSANGGTTLHIIHLVKMAVPTVAVHLNRCHLCSHLDSGLLSFWLLYDG